MEIFRLFGSVFVKDEASKALDKVETKADGVNKKMGFNFKDVGKKATDLGKKLETRLTLPIAGVGVVAGKLGMDFEASMSNVSALSGATGNDLKQLEVKARDMGAKTSKSAKDAADAMGYMALAGWKNKDIMGGIEPVLRLAEAGNLDLAKASALTTDSLSAMGLTVKDLPHYLDVVAQTARSSNTDIDQMAEAYIRVGGTLKGLNVPMEESAVILGMLANKGIKGSEAGTALNAVVTNLTAPTGRAEEALSDLGLTAFDSNGKFKGLSNVLMELKEKTKDMTEEERQQTLAMIGGKEHVKDLNALLSGLDGDYNKLTKSINESDGALNDMAKTMQDNNKGSITELKSALEELGLKIYDNLKPAIANIVTKLQEWTDKLNSLSPEQQKMLIKVAEIIAILPLIIHGFGTVCTGIDRMKKAFDIGKTAVGGMGKALGFFATHPTAIVIAAVAGLVILIITHWDKVKEVTSKVFSAIGDFLSGVWKGIKEVITTVINSIKSVITTVFGAIKTFIVTIWTGIATFFSTIWEGIKTIFTVAFLAIKFVVDTGMTLIVTIIRVPLEFIKTLFETIWNAIGDTVMGALTSIRDFFVGIWNGIVDFFIGILNAIKGKITEQIMWEDSAWNKLKGIVTDIWNAIKDAIMLIVKKIKEIVMIVWNALLNITMTVFNAIKSFALSVWNGIKTIITTVVNTIKQVVTTAWNAIKTVTTTIWNGIKAVITGVWNGIKTVITTVVNVIKSIITNTWNGIKSITTTIWNGIKTAMVTPINIAKDKIKGIVDTIKGFFTKLKLKLPKIEMPPLPHFSLQGKFSLKEMSVPKLKVDWFSEGGIFTSPTVLGNVGVGDANHGFGNNAEAVLPLNVLWDKLDKNFNKLKQSNIDEEKIAKILARTLKETDKNIIINFDSREVARVTAKPMSEELGKLNRRGGRY